MHAHSFIIFIYYINHVIHSTTQCISIISNHKFITPLAISTLRDFSLSQNRQPILAQPNFHTLYKSGQCSPKHKLFSVFFVSWHRWDLQPHIHTYENVPKVFHSTYLADCSKVSTFFWDTRYTPSFCSNFIIHTISIQRASDLITDEIYRPTFMHRDVFNDENHNDFNSK